VYRRPFVLVASAVAVLALVLAPAALALRVHVRVEGMTRTIFGATEPVLDVTAADRTSRPANALDALEFASVAGEFYYHVKQFSFGPYVDQIGRYPAGGTNGWVFKVNGASPPVGADQVQLKDGDTVLWYFAQFGIVPGGPKTLRLTHAGKNCYRVLAEDDSGTGVSATGAVLHIGSKRTVRTQGGIRCIAPHRGLLVRATLPGAIRSNALT
jgi:hypothetical protein